MSVCLEVFQAESANLGGIRYAPFFLKEYCYRAIGPDVRGGTMPLDGRNNSVTWDLKEFATHMQEEKVTYQEGKCFGIVICRGGHVHIPDDAGSECIRGDSSIYGTPGGKYPG